jgi:hypothetical protein
MAVDRIAAACGGRDLLTGAAAVLREGVAVEADGSERPLAILSRGAAVELYQMDGGGERWAVERGLGYRIDRDGKHEPITDVSLAPLVLQGTGAALPWILLANREVVEPSGETIVLRLTPWLTLRVAVAPETGLPASLDLIPREDEGGGMRAFLSDYRTVAGIRIPFAEEYLVDGRPAGSFRATRAVVNPTPETGGPPPLKGTP